MFSMCQERYQHQIETPSKRKDWKKMTGQVRLTHEAILFQVVVLCHLKSSHRPPPIVSFPWLQKHCLWRWAGGLKRSCEPIWQMWKHHSQHLFIIFSPCWSQINPMRWMLSPFVRWGNGGLRSVARWGKQAANCHISWVRPSIPYHSTPHAATDACMSLAETRATQLSLV